MRDNPEMRVRRRVAMVSALLCIVSPSVQAADLAKTSREALEAYRPQSTAHRNLYVRGDVAIGRYSFGGFSQEELATNGGTFISDSISDTVIVAGGIGIQVNPRFRFDMTGEYRSTAQIKGMDNVTAEIIGPDGTLQANTLYQGSLNSYVGLLNGYFDLLTWRGFTPYFGAGVGLAHHKMLDFTTASSATFTDAATGTQAVQLSNGTARPHTQTNWAWALMAGTSYDLGINAKLDLGYRYINLGSGVSVMTDLIDCTCGTVGQPLKMWDLDAHEFRIGIRWSPGVQPSHEHGALK